MNHCKLQIANYFIYIYIYSNFNRFMGPVRQWWSSQWNFGNFGNFSATGERAANARVRVFRLFPSYRVCGELSLQSTDSRFRSDCAKQVCKNRRDCENWMSSVFVRWRYVLCYDELRSITFLISSSASIWVSFWCFWIVFQLHLRRYRYLSRTEIFDKD